MKTSRVAHHEKRLTYLACTLGIAAARRFYAVKYIRSLDLRVEF